MASCGFIAYETARGVPSVDPDPDTEFEGYHEHRAFLHHHPDFYPNGVPHIGHAYTAIATDVLARFQRLDGKDVFFLSGTDEHGQKMQQTAEKEGIKPIELADRNSAVFRDMLVKLNCSNDDFIRTTEERHKRSVQELWKRMEANGDIYLDNYGGWYSVRQEAYFDEAKPPLAKTACGANRSALRSNGWKRRAIISGCRPTAKSSGALREKSGFRGPGRTAQRSGEFRQIRPQGPFDFPHDL
jgi:methionyl-tRNA synthetase